MNRRSFLSSLSAFAATAALDPERLLWVKSKTTFVPPAPKVVQYYGGVISGTELAEIQRRYNLALSAHAEIIRESLIGLRFVEGYAWPVGTISKREFRRRYPDSKLSV